MRVIPIIWLAVLVAVGVLLLPQSAESQKPRDIPFPSVDWYVFWDSVVKKPTDTTLLNQLFYQAHKARTQRDFLQAVEYFTRLMKLQLRNRDTLAHYKTSLYLADIYYQMGYYPEAARLLTKALRYFRSKPHLKEQVAYALSLSVPVHLHSGDIPLAENHLLELEKLNRQLHNPEVRMRWYFAKGMWLASNDPDNYLQALEALDSAIHFSQALGKEVYLARSLFYKANIYQHIDSTEEAVKALLQALQTDEGRKNAFFRRQCFRKLADNLQQLGKFEEANLYLNAYIQLNDSLLNRERQSIINRLIVKYETEQKQREIQLLEDERRRRELQVRLKQVGFYAIAVTISALLIIVFIMGVYYYNRLKSNQIIIEQQKKINEQRIKELQREKELATMESMLKGQQLERARVARDLHDSLGGLLSTIRLRFDELIHGSNNAQQKTTEIQKIKELIHLACQEVRIIARNLMPTSLDGLGLEGAVRELIRKYQKGSKAEINLQCYNLQTPVPQSKIIHIYHIIQELLHNSIKHANARHILVQLTEQDGYLQILVEDDGTGYDPTTAHRGMGTENIRFRVNYLHAEINVQSAPDEGTSTLIVVPLNEDELVLEHDRS